MDYFRYTILGEKRNSVWNLKCFFIYILIYYLNENQIRDLYTARCRFNFPFYFATIQPLIKKYVFSAKCCNSQDNSGAPLSTAKIASITFMPFFLIEDMYALILQKATAPSMLLKVPEIFCCSFIILMSRSALLLSNETFRLLRNLRIGFLESIENNKPW